MHQFVIYKPDQTYFRSFFELGFLCRLIKIRRFDNFILMYSFFLILHLFLMPLSWDTSDFVHLTNDSIAAECIEEKIQLTVLRNERFSNFHQAEVSITPSFVPAHKLFLKKIFTHNYFPVFSHSNYLIFNSVRYLHLNVHIPPPVSV